MLRFVFISSLRLSCNCKLGCRIVVLGQTRLASMSVPLTIVARSSASVSGLLTCSTGFPLLTSISTGEHVSGALTIPHWRSFCCQRHVILVVSFGLVSVVGSSSLLRWQAAARGPRTRIAPKIANQILKNGYQLFPV